MCAPCFLNDKFRKPSFSDPKSSGARNCITWAWVLSVLAVIGGIVVYYLFTRGEVGRTATIKSIPEFDTLWDKSTSPVRCDCAGHGRVSDIFEEGFFSFDGPLMDTYEEGKGAALGLLKADAEAMGMNYYDTFAFFMANMQSTIFDVGHVALPPEMMTKELFIARLREDAVARGDATWNSLRNSALLQENGPGLSFEASVKKVEERHKELSGQFRHFADKLDTEVLDNIWAKFEEHLDANNAMEEFFGVCNLYKGKQDCLYTEQETIVDIILKTNAQMATVMAYLATFWGALYGLCVKKEGDQEMQEVKTTPV